MLERRKFMNNVHYDVSGIAGQESKTRVKNALEKIEGVQQVAVDVARGTVEVGFSDYVNSEEIRQCIEHAGYTIKNKKK
jgi:copper chaperone CopZ